MGFEEARLDELVERALAGRRQLVRLVAQRVVSRVAPFLHVLLWVGLLFYFITTSDSGSFVDDKLADQRVLLESFQRDLAGVLGNGVRPSDVVLTVTAASVRV